MYLFKELKIFIMRLTLFFAISCVVISMATAEEAQSQTKKETGIELSLTNESIVTIIESISRETGYKFVYDEDFLSKMSPVTILLKDATILEALQNVANQTGLRFRKQDEMYLIFHAADPIRPDKPEAIVQQGIQITGMVADMNGDPLPGATIIIKGTTTGIVSDADGRYAITVPDENAVLQFSYIGFVTQEIPVGQKKTVNVTLQEATTQIEEVVVVAYGVQKKLSVTGAISTVQTKELKQSSAANFSTALAGRLPGLTVLQTSGMPGNDAVNLYLRGVGTLNGNDPLILIDGIPRSDINSLDPNEIASVSILKDASATAVFGVRGANGVILITSRRGSEGKTELSVSVDHSIQSFTTRPDRVHSWEFAELRNEAGRNDGLTTLPFTPWMIDMYRSGADRVFFPDRDIFHEFFYDWAPQTRVNVNLNGGIKNLRYFLNTGYVGQEGLTKAEPKESLGYDASFRMNRYSFRANVDYDVTRRLKLSLNLPVT